MISPISLWRPRMKNSLCWNHPTWNWNNDPDHNPTLLDNTSPVFRRVHARSKRQRTLRADHIRRARRPESLKSKSEKLQCMQLYMCNLRERMLPDSLLVSHISQCRGMRRSARFPPRDLCSRTFPFAMLDNHLSAQRTDPKTPTWPLRFFYCVVAHLRSGVDGWYKGQNWNQSPHQGSHAQVFWTRGFHVPLPNKVCPATFLLNFVWRIRFCLHAAILLPSGARACHHYHTYFQPFANYLWNSTGPPDTLQGPAGRIILASLICFHGTKPQPLCFFCKVAASKVMSRLALFSCVDPTRYVHCTHLQVPQIGPYYSLCIRRTALLWKSFKQENQVETVSRKWKP